MANRGRDGLAAAHDRSFPYDALNAGASLSASRQSHQKRFSIATPESVVKSFNTRAFKREQPDNENLLLQSVSAAIARNEPLPFTMYWGKGFRSYLAAPELICLDYLASFSDRIQQSYAPGARITLIFTDTHAELNGHSQQAISEYFEALTQGAHQRGFETCLLGRLMRTHEPPAGRDALPAPLSEELFSALCACAAKWFRGNGTIEQGAILYYRSNMLEKQVVERAFLRSIFVTFNGSDMRPLLPDGLPVFYMYSLRRGVCAKPWFLPADYLCHDELPNARHINVARSN